jgi:hypothetical protein
MPEVLINTLQQFDSIGLSEMERVKLLRRTDKKYLMHRDKLEDFLLSLSPYYFMLEHVGKRVMHYETQYYDTKDLDLYNLHLHGHGRRWKVRKRHYTDSDVLFFELKTRTNKGKTEKQRVNSTNYSNEFAENETDLLKDELPFESSQLIETLSTGYDRITLVNKTINERITIDTALTFTGNHGSADMSNLVIVEVKQGDKSLSPALKALRELRQKPGGISKYCLGLISTIPELPSNRFKPMLLKIQKLIQPPNYAQSTV